MKKIVTLFLIFCIVLNCCFAFDLPWQQKNAEEFIDMETYFAFSDFNSGTIATLYPKKTNIIPKFDVDEDLNLWIEVNPSLIENIAKNVRDSEKDRTREILVEVTFQKSKDIKVALLGGINPISAHEDKDRDGTQRFLFGIRNDKDLYSSFQFHFLPSDVGKVAISVAYYAKEPYGLKIVRKNCDVSQTIEFVK